MGLHMEIKVSTDVPFWLSEIRKRSFAGIYSLDKSICTFVGRPPRLPRKYCYMQLPLSLHIDTLHLQGAELEEAVNRLDADGWSTDKTLRGTILVRASLATSMIREDILELSLGTIPQGDLTFAQ